MKEWVRALAGLGGVGLVTIIFIRMLTVNSGTTVALTFLLCFNFFFIPPVGTFGVADPENRVALAAFLAVSLLDRNLHSYRIRTGDRDRQ